MSSSKILQEADEIAGESRSRDYGHPKENHERIAGIWNGLLSGILKRPLTAREAALMMIGLKLAREINTPKRDNLVDICGYVKCIEMIDEATENSEETVIDSPFAPVAMPKPKSYYGD